MRLERSSREAKRLLSGGAEDLFRGSALDDGLTRSVSRRIPGRQEHATRAFVARSEASAQRRSRGFIPRVRPRRWLDAERSATHSGEAGACDSSVRRAKRSVSSAAEPRIYSEGPPSTMA